MLTGRRAIATLNMVREDPACQEGEDISIPRDSDIGTTSRLRISTINVGSCSGKANEILHQCHLEDLHIIGIQESRATAARTLVNDPYRRFISAGCKGQAGVELWMNCVALAKIFACDFQPDKDVCIWHATESILAAHSQLGSTALEILVIFAPQKGKGTQQIVDWWKQLKEVMERRNKHALFFILGDCNCRIGSIESQFIGGLDPDFEDEGGEQLHEICRSNNFIIPCTF